MKIRHSPHHWIAVAVVLAVLLLTLSTAHGLSSGAQAGQGAMAGPSQGGIAVENSTDMQRRRDVEPSRTGFGDFVA